MEKKQATLADLKQDHQNARKHTSRNISQIEASLRQVGAARSGVVNAENLILAGNGTFEALSQAGIEKVVIVDSEPDEWVVVRRSGLTEQQERLLAMADNRAAELATWDPELLQSQGIDLKPWFTEAELKSIDDLQVIFLDKDNEDIDHATLAARFIIPPFSILDARQGYWQDRKRAWLSLGIQSELGRGGAPGGSPRPAAQLTASGHTVRGDGYGREIS